MNIINYIKLTSTRQVLNGLRGHKIEGSHLCVLHDTGHVRLHAAGDAKINEFESPGHQQKVGRFQIRMDDTPLKK